MSLLNLIFPYTNLTLYTLSLPYLFQLPHSNLTFFSIALEKNTLFNLILTCANLVTLSNLTLPYFAYITDLTSYALGRKKIQYDWMLI